MNHPVWTPCTPETIDLDRTGLQLLSVSLDFCREDGVAPLHLPLALFGRGNGPTLLLTGGTHGDELEGQAVAWHLIRTLSDDDVSGRLIILPHHNRPACLARTRVSPLDGLDLNRIFPGGDAPGPSHAIARLVSGLLMPHSDVYLDLHTGGRDHAFVLSSNLQGRPGTTRFERDLPGLLAMDAPYAIVFDADETDTMPHHGTTEAHFQSLGRPAFSSEYGGGRMTAQSFQTALRGTFNLLRHFGILSGQRVSPDNSRSQLLFMRGGPQYVPAPAAGVLVPHVELGDRVARGAMLGEIFADAQGAVAELRAASGGVVVAMSTRCPDIGDPAFMMAEPLTRNPLTVNQSGSR